MCHRMGNWDNIRGFLAGRIPEDVKRFWLKSIQINGLYLSSRKNFSLT